MQLEKVTNRSSEASLAGWISSNDATLFTVVLVVVIAIFLHAKVSKGSRESALLKGEQQTLADSLATTASERDAAKDLLDTTSQKLSLTEDERDQLRQQLNEKLERIAALVSKLDVALEEKGQISDERESLATESAALKSSNVTLRERLDALTEELAAKLRTLDDLTAERDRLKMQADELESIVARLEQANVELAGSRDSAAAARSATESRIEELENLLATDGRKADEYLAQLKRSAALLDRLNLEKGQLQSALTHAQQQRQAALAEEAQHNRELVGLTGRLGRVAILFDASGSMRQASTQGDGDRWAEAQDIAATWLNHLRLEQCVLIVYSTDVRTFPADRSLADLRGQNAGAVRADLLAKLKAVRPEGMTNTLAALQKAYEYDIDTILLFSDGAPSMVDTGVFDPTIAQRIYDLCRQHPGIPVNTMGLGNYFDKEMSTFLRTVARITGGTFRGK